MPKQIDHSMLQAALAGYQAQLSKIDNAMAVLRRQLGGKAPASAGGRIPMPGKRRLSAAARKRIALAQKKRWAAYHAKQKA